MRWCSNFSAWSHLKSIKSKAWFIKGKLDGMIKQGEPRLGLDLFKMFIEPLFAYVAIWYWFMGKWEQEVFEKERRSLIKTFVGLPKSVRTVAIEAMAGSHRDLAVKE